MNAALALPEDYKPLAKISDDYIPTEKEDYMCDKHLEYFRRKLLAWRQELLDESKETMDHLKEENWQEPDIADRASIETEAGVELRTRNRYLKLISKIDAALRRIDTGDYGFCEETGDPIGLRRLEARPVATMCIEAQERHEKTEKQYSDEEED
jgi:DnaK suppressor protein